MGEKSFRSETLLFAFKNIYMLECFRSMSRFYTGGLADGKRKFRTN